VKSSDAARLMKAIFDYLPVQKFLDEYPEFSERMVYELRDQVAELLQTQSLQEERSFSLFVDGASQPQKKQAGIGGVIYLNDSEIESFSENIGEATNNEAEYQALIRGCQVIRKFKPERVYIFADSELLVKQITGEYQVKNPRMQTLCGKAMNVLQHLPEWRIEHVPRERNKRADQLSKQAVLQGEA